jgi:hypothetical protein
VAYLKLLSRSLPGGTEGNHENPVSQYSRPGPDPNQRLPEHELKTLPPEPAFSVTSV